MNKYWKKFKCKKTIYFLMYFFLFLNIFKKKKNKKKNFLKFKTCRKKSWGSLNLFSFLYFFLQVEVILKQDKICFSIFNFFNICYLFKFLLFLKEIIILKRNKNWGNRFKNLKIYRFVQNSSVKKSTKKFENFLF